MKILVTGGAGFIGSALVRFLIEETDNDVLNVDKLTYAGHLESLVSIEQNPRYRFIQADICDATRMQQIIADFRPDKIMHLAAESHVDRSVDGPDTFIQTNIIGTFNLLSAARALYEETRSDTFMPSRRPPVPGLAPWPTAISMPSAARR